MSSPFWFNRMVEYWSIPLRFDLADVVRRGGIQMVQAGTFGPQFYALADDPDADRRWVGMPLVGIRDNLALARDTITRTRKAGARFVGQMSMSWHYGDHETNKGLFEVWNRLWTDDLLGPAPCSNPELAQERLEDGAIRCWPIEGRPYRAYSGCISNPLWVATLKPMVRKAIELGVDGLMVHHNFTALCRCAHCQDYARSRFRDHFSAVERGVLFGTERIEEVKDVFVFQPDSPEALRKQAEFAVQQWTHRRRKEVFDEIYIHYGRSLKPDLMVSQWYHKYNFKPSDERSLLPNELWARDEDYIWYSQGSHKGISAIAQGYLADMGLPARFVHAAGGGRPFVINKYDYKRFRVSMAEAAANHAAAPAYHWAPQEDPEYHLEDYLGPLVRYHRFLADHENLIHPAAPWSYWGLIYPRRAETAGEGDALNALRRIGRLMEDHHVLFDMLIDEQLMERMNRYRGLILPGIRRLSEQEAESACRFVERGGRLIITGETGTLRPDGHTHNAPLFADWGVGSPESATASSSEYPPTIIRVGKGLIYHIPDGPWLPEQVEVRPGVTLPVYPLPDQDIFGKSFAGWMKKLNRSPLLLTDAPWHVRVRAWRPKKSRAITLHWVNYHQVEDAAIETPVPTGPIRVNTRIPSGWRVERVEWRYPEMSAPATLPHTEKNGRVFFTIPGVIVYGLSVIYLMKR